MDAPVSWLVIKPGWKVYSSEGTEVGEVDEVSGDETRDIFNGIALATSALGKPRYIPADQVAEITDGGIRLSLTADQVEALEEYLDPATSAQIEPDSTGGAAAGAVGELRELEGLVRPVKAHQRSVNIWRRMYLLVRRVVKR